MQIQQRMNYRFANEVLDSPKFAESKNQIFQVIESIEVPKLIPPKTRNRGKKTWIFSTDQKKLNTLFEEAFEPLGWEVHPRITNDNSTKIEADFKKDRIQIEIQFGNMARWYTDVFKFQVSYSLDLIDVGVLICPMQEFADTIDENVVYFERINRELGYAKMSITLPILVLGIKP
jgi:hypothetical protein